MELKKRIMIVSDTHRHLDNLKLALARELPIDGLIHCGDVEGQEKDIARLAGCPVYIVRGNNDFFTDLPREREEFLFGKRIMITHGHNYGVSLDLSLLRDEAAVRGVDICFFGHTHRPVIEQGSGVTIVNPGSLSFPRQADHKPTYIMMTIDRTGNAEFTLKTL
jgi:putative phosphoesterase